MNIGIIITLSKEDETIFSNGIKLNALNLAKTLMEIPGYDVFIMDGNETVKDLTKVSWDYEKYKTVKYSKMKNEMDLIIMLGAALSDKDILNLKTHNPKLKVIKYQCGNNYVIDMERVLFGIDDNSGALWSYEHDETWLIPQQEYHNREYYEVTYRQNSEQVKVVPFIWDPEQLNRYLGLTPNSELVYYKPKNNPSEKKIMVMEPNMNVVKYSMIPMLIGEKVLRDSLDGEPYKKLIIANGNLMIKNSYFKNMLAKLDVLLKQKIKFIPRYPVLALLKNETDVVLSHQWANPLNYAYLDALYFGYPLVHNADFIKDGGYYYPHFKINEGVEMLKKALNDHDNNIEDYKERNQKVLDRYTSTNKDVVETYRKLIENLFEPNKHKLSYEYDVETNLYK
jgi:hypothetical protein